MSRQDGYKRAAELDRQLDVTLRALHDVDEALRGLGLQLQRLRDESRLLEQQAIGLRKALMIPPQSNWSKTDGKA